MTHRVLRHENIVDFPIDVDDGVGRCGLQILDFMTPLKRFLVESFYLQSVGLRGLLCIYRGVIQWLDDGQN